MITVYEYIDILFVDETRKSVDCSGCGKPITFYQMSPDRCMFCGNNLISATCILSSSTYKINYHNGLVDKRGRLRMMAG